MIYKSCYWKYKSSDVDVLANYPQPRIVQIPTRGNLLNALSLLTTKSRFDLTKIVKSRLTSQELAYYLRFIKD